MTTGGWARSGSDGYGRIAIRSREDGARAQTVNGLQLAPLRNEVVCLSTASTSASTAKPESPG